MAGQIKRRLYHILETGRTPDLASKVTDWMIGGLIVANIIAVCIETLPAFQGDYGRYFTYFEWFSVAVFTIEYGLRVWVCVEHPPLQDMHPLRARLHYATTPLALVDLIAIAPFYLQFLIGIDLRVMRIFRLLRFMKLAHFSPALVSLGRVLMAERRALAAALLIMVGMLLVSSALIYAVEAEAQPEAFGSIPHAMWWALATLTTVGYGDIVPLTPVGKIIGGIVMLLGLGMFALPIGIIATGFAHEIHLRDFAVTWGMVARVPVFRHVDGQTIARIVGLLEARSVRPGGVIVAQDEELRGLYLISSGEVEIEGENGMRSVLRSGDFFGENALFGAETGRSTFRALTQVDLLFLGAYELSELIRDNPQLAEEMNALIRVRQAELANKSS